MALITSTTELISAAWLANSPTLVSTLLRISLSSCMVCAVSVILSLVVVVSRTASSVSLAVRWAISDTSVIVCPISVIAVATWSVCERWLSVALKVLSEKSASSAMPSRIACSVTLISSTSSATLVIMALKPLARCPNSLSTLSSRRVLKSPPCPDMARRSSPTVRMRLLSQLAKYMVSTKNTTASTTLARTDVQITELIAPEISCSGNTATNFNSVPSMGITAP